jgi:ABC-type uncharacterized transport system permease subunit
MMKPTVDAKELRKFALTMFCALGILGSFLVWRRRDIGFVLWGIGSVALLIAWVRPRALKPVYKYWMKLAIALGFVTSHVVLGLLYYLVFTPLGLVMRLLGKNPLVLQPDKGLKSYWVIREGGTFDKKRCEKMF